MSNWAPPPDFDGYRIVEALGSGAMGRVYLAHERALDRLVAIKVLAPVTPGPTLHARFINEARALARLQHANVVAIHRIGEIHDRPYIVYEYVAGRTLDQLEGPLSWEDALPIALGLARGLSAVHAANVLHRDIKPANAILTEHGCVKLIDFGLAKFDGVASEERSRALVHAAADSALAVAPELSVAGAIIGTPRYLPPERWEGRPATTRSDIYSLGLVLYQLCTGRRPYEGFSTRDMMRVSRSQERPHVASRDEDIPRPFAEIIDRCIAHDPHARFADAGELLAPLEELELLYRTFRVVPAETRLLTDHAHRALCQSFARLLPQADRFVARTYERLFDEAPSLRVLFHPNMVEQRRKLAGTLRLVIEQLHRPAEVNPLLEELGQRHARYGVKAADFDALSRALLASIAEIEGHAWTAELEATWARALQQITSTMLRGVRAPRELLHRGAPHASVMPAVRYARSGDATLAYQVFGSGPIDLVVVREWVSHLEAAWRWPTYARYLWALGEMGRVILFDPCGVGVSERGLPLRSIDERLEDVRAVMDAAGSASAVVYGTSLGSLTAQLFAVQFPERTRGLVSFAGTTRLSSAREAPFGWREASVRSSCEQIRVGWGGPLFVDRVAPSVAKDEAFRSWWASYLRTSTSPVTATRLLRMDAAIDTRRALDALRVPALVLHRAGDRFVDPGGSRDLARRIADARYVELPGSDHLPFTSDPAPLLDALWDFIDKLQTERRAGPTRSLDSTDACDYAKLGFHSSIHVSREDMDALDPALWTALPGSIRERLPGEDRAPGCASIVLRKALHVLPEFVDRLCVRLHLDLGVDWLLWRWIAALYLVERQVGPATVFDAGRHFLAAMPLPSEPATIEDAFRSLGLSFRAVHHDPASLRAGELRIVDRAPGRILLDGATLYPCHFEEGIIAAVCERFARARAEYGLLSTTKPKREGGTVTRYLITYDTRAGANERSFGEHDPGAPRAAGTSKRNRMPSTRPTP